jgi:hypothetical protein
MPFGKYKDQPIDLVLADQDYVEWLAGQPGIMTMMQKRFPAIFNIITVGSPRTEDTPEHNKMQALFLSRDFQYAFIESVLGESVYSIAQEVASKRQSEIIAKLPRAHELCGEAIIKLERDIVRFERDSCSAASEWVKETKKKLSNVQSVAEKLSNPQNETQEILEPKIQPEFECGYDLLVRANWPSVRWRFNSRDWEIGAFGHEIWALEEYFAKSIQFRIELKPQIGDDFPSVLRQVKRSMGGGSPQHHRDVVYCLLVIGTFESAACTLEQVRSIFGGFRIVTLAEIQAIQARGVWPGIDP